MKIILKSLGKTGKSINTCTLRICDS